MSEKQLEAVTKIAYAMGSLSLEKQQLVTLQTEAFINGMKAQETILTENQMEMEVRKRGGEN